MQVSPFRYLRLNGYLLLPQLFSFYHVFRRLLVPRHPPCALVCLTSFLSFYSVRNWVFVVKNAFPIIFGFELSFLVFSDVLIKYISSKSLYEVFKVQSSTLCVAIRNCNAISVYFKIVSIYLKYFQILLTVLSVIRNFNLLKSLITHKTILFYNPAVTSFPYRLQYSIIGRLSLNHRVRDVDGCFP